MKRTFLILFSLILFFTGRVSAQETVDDTIGRLKTEIARREMVDRDQTTPLTLKTTNAAKLEQARTALLLAVQAKVSILEKYLNTLGDSISPEEKKEVRSALGSLSADANLAAKSGPVAPAPEADPATPLKSASLSSATAPTSSSPPAPAVVKIVTPADQSSTKLSEAEVVVQLDDYAPPPAFGLKIKVENSGNEFFKKDFVVDPGRREAVINIPLRAGDNKITVEFAANAGVNNSITVTMNGSDNNKTFTRAIVGLEQAAAASAKPEQKLFLEFNLSAPLFGDKTKPIDAPVWLWLNPRITSLPQQLTSTVAEFSTAANFTAPFTGGKVNNIVQGFEFLGGAEVKLHTFKGTISSGFGSNTKVRFGLAFVAAAGMSTPFGSQQVGPQFFKVNSTVSDAFPGAKGKEFIAFVTADRNRFFRQYYGGLRLKSYFVKGGNGNQDELDNIFPGIIDLTFGQNETVTGGALHGGIARIEGIYPLPFVPDKYRGALYAFGSALLKLNKPKTPAPIILQPADKAPEFPADNVFIQQVPARDADHYRIGIGVDLMRLFKANN